MPAIPLDIKAVVPSDIEALLGFARESFKFTYSHLNTSENMTSYLENTFTLKAFSKEYENPESEFYIGTRDEHIVGYYKLNFGAAQSESNYPNSAEIERFYVHPKYKSLGFGKKMIEHAMKICTSKGLTYLWLGVWEKNPAALSFYEKVGFQAIADHTFQLGNDIQRDIIMKMDFPPES